MTNNIASIPAFKAAIKAIKRLSRKYPMKESTRIHRQNAYKFRMKKWPNPLGREPLRDIDDISPLGLWHGYWHG